MGPFGLLVGPGMAETGRLAPKTLPHSVRGWYAYISCAWAPYETSTALLGPPKGPVLASKGPKLGPPGLPKDLRGPQKGLSRPKWALLGPPGVPKWSRKGPEHMIWIRPTQFDQPVALGTN